jgi:malate dehydrogenase (oxaloacetate-decarboxylating)
VKQQPSNLHKYVYLNEVHDRNQVLYFKLLADHLAELLPVVYDPTVGEAIEKWSVDYRDSRALYLSIDRPEDVKAPFESLGLGADDVDLIVVSDAQEIQGIGDWGVNGTDISHGQTRGLHRCCRHRPEPRHRCEPGRRHGQRTTSQQSGLPGQPSRTSPGKRYNDFIALYRATASELFPNALLHFEDFGPSNAWRILVEKAGKYRIFNDDMQGTGAIVMASAFSALKVTGGRWSDQRLVVFGAGTAGTGMADQIHAAMLRDGATPDQARRNIWLIDVHGLVTEDTVTACVGLTDSAIARAEGWSERTTQRRIQRLMSTLGATTRFQAAALAARRGWL